ncbi:MAG: hypothetical protein WD184_03905 [Acidimicrobiia bacterium]
MRIRSGITRRFDFSYRSNRFAVVATLGSGIVAGCVGLLSGGGWWPAVADGVLAGGASFLSWATARELDPDHPVSAGIAAVLAPVLLVAGPANLLVMTVLLVSVRVVGGTTGRAMRPIDLLFLGLGAALICLRAGGGAVATVAALAPALSAWWHRPARRLLFVGSVAILLAVAALSVFIADPGPWLQPEGLERGLLVSGLAAGLVATWVVAPLRSATDSRHGGRILESRIRLARVMTVVACVGAAMWSGAAGVLAVAPAWAALATTAVSSIAALAE